MDLQLEPSHLSFFERNVAQKRYPKSAFDTEENANSSARICNAHSHVHAAWPDVKEPG